MDQKRALRQFRRIVTLKGHMRLAAEQWKNDFQILIATILSARSLDETTIVYATKLFRKYPAAQKLAAARISDVQTIVRPINFYRNKSRHVIQCSKELVENYNGKVPRDFEKLVALPGVGSKTANVFLSEVGEDTIGVDTHVYYISRYLGWSESTKPEKVGEDLQKLFPRRYWKKLNATLVKFGKKYTSRKEKNGLLDEIKRL